MVKWWHNVSISIIKSSLSSTQLGDSERYEWKWSFWLFSQTLAAGVTPNPSALLPLLLSSTARSQPWQGLNGELRKKCHKAGNKQRTIKCSDSQVIFAEKLQKIDHSLNCISGSAIQYTVAFKFTADSFDCVMPRKSVSNWTNNRNSGSLTEYNE